MSLIVIEQSGYLLLDTLGIIEPVLSEQRSDLRTHDALVPGVVRKPAAGVAEITMPETESAAEVGILANAIVQSPEARGNAITQDGINAQADEPLQEWRLPERRRYLDEREATTQRIV